MLRRASINSRLDRDLRSIGEERNWSNVTNEFKFSREGGGGARRKKKKKIGFVSMKGCGLV